MRMLLALSIGSFCFAGEPIQLPLWKGAPPDAESTPDRETTTKDKDGERRTRNVSRPDITVYLPSGKATGAAVIIAPGGGYVHLAIDKEGHDVAAWLSKLGIAGVVLKYRVMPTEDGVAVGGRDPHKRAKQAALAKADGLRAIQLVREHAAEWKIDPNRVAIMGFSAGGHVVANVALQPDAATRPNLLVMIYPGAPQDLAFPQGTPPAFLVHADDDSTAPSLNSIRIYEALRKANVPAELHIYAKGKHGFGVRPTGTPTDGWLDRYKDWLQLQGWLEVR